MIREIVYLGLFTQEVYAPIIEHLEEIGYQEGKDLFVFDYDWRLSVFDNAELLAAFIRQNVPGETEPVDILAHSMGGLIARVYAFKHGEAARIGRLISAGTPFLGSVKVFATLERGWGTMNMLMGGLTAFRQTVLSFPSTFELMPRYGGCCESEGGAPAAFAPNKVQSWLALGWDGIDASSLPNLENVAARQRELQEIVNAGLSGDAEDIMLIGVDQRTPQQFAIELRRGRARLRLRTTWAGDGTVLRDSAVMPRAAVHPTSFSDHEHILDDPQVQEFLRVTLTRGLDEAIRTVPVRPRSRVRTAFGKLTELVGVAVVADEPVYGTGQKSTVHVHVRLGEREPLSLQRIRLTVRRPDGTEAPVVLRPDPLASDPTNPFEQSFAGEFDSGTTPGSAIVTAAVLIDEALPRVVTRVLPIVAQ